MSKNIACCLSFGLSALILLSGCTLVTPPPEEKTRFYGPDLVINEVFSLPPDRYYAYSWIELYNPTDRPIAWYARTKVSCARSSASLALRVSA